MMTTATTTAIQTPGEFLVIEPPGALMSELLVEAACDILLFLQQQNEHDDSDQKTAADENVFQHDGLLRLRVGSRRRRRLLLLAGCRAGDLSICVAAVNARARTQQLVK